MRRATLLASPRVNRLEFQLHDDSRVMERTSGVFMFLVNMILRLDRREAGLLGAVAADSLGNPMSAPIGTDAAGFRTWPIMPLHDWHKPKVG